MIVSNKIALFLFLITLLSLTKLVTSQPQDPKKCFILLNSNDLTSLLDLKESIIENDGRIFHVVPPNVIIANITDDIQNDLKNKTNVDEVYCYSPIDIPNEDIYGRNVIPITNSWNTNFTVEELNVTNITGREGQLPEPSEEELYADYVKTKFGITSEEAEAQSILPPQGYYRTSDYLIGSVAVGIIFPEGSRYKWIPPQQDIAVSKIQNGLDWLGSQEPRASNSWTYDSHYNVPVSTEPCYSNRTNYHEWAYEAMQYLGYSGNWTGIYDYLNVTGRETAQYFGACDEYCDPSYSCCGCGNCGYLRIPNSNCEAGCYEGHEHGCTSCVWGGNCLFDFQCSSEEYCNILSIRCKPNCIMLDGNRWNLCVHTRQQLGWRDCNGDNILDLMEPAENIGDAGDEPSVAGSCLDSTQWSGCTKTNQVDEWCFGNSVYEYWADGLSCSGDWRDCGNDYCSGTCGLGTNSCTYRDRGCASAACYVNAYDADAQQSYCTSCNQYWNIGGEVAATTCCGDDAGEKRRTCIKGGAVTENACSIYLDGEACCSSSGDCVYNGNCYSSGDIHPAFSNIKCRSGKWDYGCNPLVCPSKTQSQQYCSGHCAGEYCDGCTTPAGCVNEIAAAPTCLYGTPICRYNAAIGYYCYCGNLVTLTADCYDRDSSQTYCEATYTGCQDFSTAWNIGGEGCTGINTVDCIEYGNDNNACSGDPCCYWRDNKCEPEPCGSLWPWSCGGCGCSQSAVACCGDDCNTEYIRTCQKSGVTADICLASNDNLACCSASNKCVYKGTCYNDGVTNPDYPCVYCNAGTWVSKGTSTLCNSGYACSLGTGDNNYNVGGNYRCQGYCDGFGSCDYAGNCEDCAAKITIDSDGGNYPLIAGTLSDYESCSSGVCTNNAYGDYCSDNILTEYYPTGTTYASTIYDCESYENVYCNLAYGDIYRNEWECSGSNIGYCSDAVDTLAQDCSETCSDTDEGTTYSTYGTVTEQNLCSSGLISCPSTVKTDECMDVIVLREYYCSGNDYTYQDYNCKNLGTDYICSDGKCVSCPGNANLDRSIDILDLIVVGNAFGSTLGQANWNPAADLKPDGIINIFDLSLVGKNYGKEC